MTKIKFNSQTRETEISGSESFIKANFYKIQALLSESRGKKKGDQSQQDRTQKEMMSKGKTDKPKEGKRADSGAAEAQGSGATSEQTICEAKQASNGTRPPVRKYFNTLGKCIRSEDTSISQSDTLSVKEKIQTEVSVASLKEKFGLSERQIEEIIRDAEKQGRVKKDLDGSYVWV
jgi:hypothetical protein